MEPAAPRELEIPGAVENGEDTLWETADGSNLHQILPSLDAKTGQFRPFLRGISAQGVRSLDMVSS